MCELTSIAATAFYAFLYKRGGRGRKAAWLTMLMFAGASLMWAIDCLANAMAGEALLDMSRADAALGVMIFCAGTIFYIVARLFLKNTDA